MMLRPQPDASTQARGVLFDPAPTITAPIERHWYVDSSDYPGYCAACSLPRANGRHVGRTA